MQNLEIKQRILNYIYDDIEEISNIDMQRKMWLNENNTSGYISSYIELMCRLFDSNNFDNFIENIAPFFGFPDELIKLLRNFKDELEKYTAKDDNDDKAIIEDPNWQKIVKKAQHIILVWNKFDSQRI